MEDAPIADGLNEWEQIQSPWHQTFSATTSTSVPGLRGVTPQSSGWDDGDAVVVSDNYVSDDSSVFPPDNHEGLPIRGIRPSIWPPSPPEEGAEVGPARVAGGIWWQRVRSHLGLLRCGILRVAIVVRNYAANRGGFWSFACMAGILVAACLWFRVRRWRRRFRRENEDHLMLLVKERDQKISQLLLQISQMNELLSARRSVPVIRVGS